MKRMLMIVDPQVDFVTGTLPVPHASEAMEKLAAYIAEENGKYDWLVVTEDWHPSGHCSFKENGGQWPVHCLQETEGADIYRPLKDVLDPISDKVEIVHKGMNENREEYSVFQNTVATALIEQLVKEAGIERIDLCGLAGDVCVLNTLKDGVNLYGASMFHVLEEYAPSLDGGTALSETIHTLLQL